MLIFYWVLFVAATVAVLDCWFLGSIFQNVRDAIQGKLDAHLANEDAVHKYHESEAGAMDATGVVVTNVKPGWPHNFVNRLPVVVLKLLVCPFCLAYHIPYVLGVAFVLPASILGSLGYTFLANAAFSPVALLATTFFASKLRTWLNKPQTQTRS